MKLLTLEVKNGQVRVPKGVPREVSEVMLLIPESDDAGFRLSVEQMEDLGRSIEEAERGETVDGHDVLRDLER
jgi:hypothetical protein